MSDNITVGLTSWNEKNQTGPREQREELPKLDFLRLKNGNNVVRILTDPYVYYHIRYKGPKSRGSFGDRVNTAWPTHADDDGNSLCPAYLNREALTNSKANPKKRYFVAVIDRGDNVVKIFDMSVLVYEQLQGILADVKEATGEDHAPSGFDINIRYNNKASSPSGFYHVMGRPPASLSEADVELIKAVGNDNVSGQEAITKILDRQSASPRPESVQRRLENLGWTEGAEAQGESEGKGNGSGNLEEADDDDYSFEKPADAPADASVN